MGNKKIILAETRSGRALTIEITEPMNAYLNESASNQTHWLTEKDARKEKNLAKDKYGAYLFELTRDAFFPETANGDLIPKKGYTARVDGGRYYNLAHVKYFFENCMCDPIVLVVED